MPDFIVKKDQAPLEIAGVGLVDSDHPVPLERAALVMTELQDEDGKPLTGHPLASAAKGWAQKVGLHVSNAEPDTPTRRSAAKE